MKIGLVVTLAAVVNVFAVPKAMSTPVSTDPSRIIDSLTPVLTPDETLNAPKIVPPQTPISPAKKTVDTPTFTLNNVEITGNTVFTKADLLAVYGDMIYEDVSFDDIQKIADAITQMYHKNNYVLSKAIVPAQEIEDGHIRIQVIEGSIKKIHIEGDAPSNSGKILKYAAKIKTEKPFNYKSMERYILLMNDLPGINVEAVLKPSYATNKTPSSNNKVVKKISNYIEGLDLKQNQQEEFLELVQNEIHKEREEQIQKLSNALQEMSFTKEQSKLLALKAFKKSQLIPNKPKANNYESLGWSDIILRVNHKKLSGFATIDNLGTKYVGPVQYGVGVQLNHNSDGKLSSTTIRANVTPDTDEMRHLSVSHEKVINDHGTKLSASYQITKSEPGSNLKELEFENESEAVSFKFIHPHIRSRSENLNSRIGLDFRKSSISSLDARLSQDRLTVLRAGATYDFADTYKGINLFDFEISKGLDIIDASRGEQNRSRANGESQFTKFTGQVSRLQKLSPQFNLLGSVRGQYSLNSLLASEEFGFGGSQFGRGLDPSEITGDHGYAAKLELIHNVELPTDYIQEYQFYTFYDFGMTWEMNEISKRKFGSTAGAGVRFKLSETYSGFLELNKPLSRNISSSGGDGGRDYNASFRIRADW